MQQTCTTCNTIFTCAIEAANKCWCAQLPDILPIAASETCLCPTCLKSKIKEATVQYAAEVKAGTRKNDAPKQAIPNQKMLEGIDYNMEDGLLVMSSWFHLKRGYCCGSGCRHCPY